jgi:hypothetical protein
MNKVNFYRRQDVTYQEDFLKFQVALWMLISDKDYLLGSRKEKQINVNDNHGSWIWHRTLFFERWGTIKVL